MREVPKSSMALLCVFLAAVGALWLAFGGPGGDPGSGDPESAEAGRTAAEGRTDQRETRQETRRAPDTDPAGEPESAEPSGGAESEPQSADVGASRSGEDADAGAVADPAADAPEQAAPDPLGMRAEAERAAREGGQEAGAAGGQRAAAANYVLYAYGYSGGDAAEYYRGLGPHVDRETFFRSPGGGEIQDRASALSEDPVRSAAELAGLRKLEEGAGGRERWSLGIRIGKPGSASGLEAPTEYEQEVVLAPSGDSSWVVEEAGPLRESG